MAIHACSLHSSWGINTVGANSIAIDPSSTAKNTGQSLIALQRLLVFKHLRTGTLFSWCTGQATLPHPSHSGPTQGNSSSLCAIANVSTLGRTEQNAANKTNTCSDSIAVLKMLDISPLFSLCSACLLEVVRSRLSTRRCGRGYAYEARAAAVASGTG